MGTFLMNSTMGLRWNWKTASSSRAPCYHAASPRWFRPRTTPPPPPPPANYHVIMPLAAGQTAAAGELLDGPLTSGVYGGGLPCPPFDPAHIEEALSTPDPDPADIEELLTASSPGPYDRNMIFHCRWEDSSSLDPYAAQHATAIST
ncbi:hypothetical protein ACP70R_043100 [Stipagrostis hirtigluma subsp. patula]